MWRIALDDILSGSRDLHLDSPLGSWSTTSHIDYTFYISTNYEVVFERSDNLWYTYTRESQRTRHGVLFRKTGEVLRRPPTMIPVLVSRYNTTLIRIESDMRCITRIIKPTPRTWTEFLSSLDASVKLILRHSHFDDDGRSLAAALKNKSAVGVTDSSVKVTTRTSSAAWILTDSV